jgi:xanthine dehydrogenase YagS FAD-binding subunit
VRVHPSNLAPPLLALDAQVTVQRGDGERRIPVMELWPSKPTAAGPDHTLSADDLVTWIHVQAGEGQPQQLRRGAREAELRLGRLCLAAVAPIPVPVAQASEMLVGKAPSAELCSAVAAAAFTGAKPLYQNAYKVQVGLAIAAQALRQAMGLEG